MNRRLSKFMCCIASAVFVCTALSSCGGGNKDDNYNPIKAENLDSISSDYIIENSNGLLIKNGNYSLKFTNQDSSEGYVVKILNSNGDVAFYQEQPAQVNVRGASTSLLGGYKEVAYNKCYDKVIKRHYGALAYAKITTESGSEFVVEDKYTLLDSGAFEMVRDIIITSANANDKGFSSKVSFVHGSKQVGYKNYEYFIPSILYKDTNDMTVRAVASNLDVDKVYVKETRMGLPMAFLREKNSGDALTISHFNPQISTGSLLSGGSNGTISDEIQYGSFGYTMRPNVSVDFTYPCSEGPSTYDDGNGWSRRYHTVENGNGHSYKIAIIPDNQSTYNDAFVNSYKTAYGLESPKIADVKIEDVYEQGIEIFNASYKEFKYNGEVKSAGLPWALDVPNGTADRYGYSFQIGFVGQQGFAGFQMYRYGLKYNNPEIYQKGKTMVDFWTSDKVMGSYFPVVWWDPADNQSGGGPRSYPSFMRCMIDGMEGLLDAYRTSVAYGEPQTKWYNAIIKFADNLIATQNDDGSFYRAFDVYGNVSTNDSQYAYGYSKNSTTIPIRFLGKMYEMTGEEKYKASALNAAEYAYSELYEKAGKYVGVTIDNPNVVDRESSMFALYAFNAAYQLSGDEKYLKASEHAAVSAMSWTYTYDYIVPNNTDSDKTINPFQDGRTSGFAIIAVGHSGADNGAAFFYYELYKLYIYTGESYYLHASEFFQNNTKSSTDHDGRMGYKYRGLGVEATNIADMRFNATVYWLPWATIASINPIVDMEETFGNKDVAKITASLEEQRDMLNSYGCGGNLQIKE